MTKTVEIFAVVQFFYTPDTRSMWGYIVFTFLFVHLFVRTYVRSFILPSQGQSFCVKVYKTSYFEDPLMDFIHIWHDGRCSLKFLSAPSPPQGWPWGQGHGLRIFVKKSKFFVFKFMYHQDPWGISFIFDVLVDIGLARHDPHPGCDWGQGHELRIFI